MRLIVPRLDIDPDPAEILKKHVAFNALHNSSTSFDKPRCHPETRMAVLDDLDQWARGEGEHVKPIRWLRGPAGAGKSAIAQTLAERWGRRNQSGGLILVAAFIFSRQRSRCSDKCHFVPTIAYQLRKNLPSTLHAIDSAILSDIALFDKSIDTQLFELIVRPLQTILQHDPVEKRDECWVIIIDGLDECSTTLRGQDYESQQLEILEAVKTVVTTHNIPLRFLIASRPEPQLRDAFSHDSLSKLVTSTSLTDTSESRADIELFVRSTFNQIRSKRRYLDPAWPREDAIAKILEKSSGHFIYASVIMRFIGQTLGDPITRLDTVLSLKTPKNLNENPYGQLDNLYTHILLTISSELFPVVNRVFDLLLSGNERDALGGREPIPATVEEYLSLRP
jgi:hypothetical protein